MQKVESLSSKRIKLIFTINTTVSIYAMYTMHINPTSKGIYTKLSVLHQYIRQMGPTCVKSYEQNIPHKLSHALTYDWKHKRFERSPVAEHFCSPEHDFLDHATLCCLDHNPEWTDRTRKARESYWIRRLNTLRPYGINKGDQ